MTQTFFDLTIRPSSAFEASLRASVLKAGESITPWTLYLLGTFSLASICAFVFIPYFSFSLNFLLLDTLLSI